MSVALATRVSALESDDSTLRLTAASPTGSPAPRTKSLQRHQEAQPRCFHGIIEPQVLMLPYYEPTTTPRDNGNWESGSVAIQEGNGRWLTLGFCLPHQQPNRSGEEETRSLGAEETDNMELQRRYIDFTSTLFREGFLDGQYAQLRQLQDESNPEFVTEVIALFFFQESEKLQDELSRTLDEEAVDFKKVDARVHQLKGSSASVGAERVKNVCMAFRICCEEMNREGCLRCLQQVPGEEQAGDSVPAGAADRGRRWIHPSQ
ncbi:hypothetical protein OPV22_004779 [Ensete ventricosum]|uniref:Histidine-containing phosphotransfer protein n=1 Tax=Ensete ventricosum TaxID=4639 RepID=A0AAV8RPN7_ENSVE|nr:hypothetical protein OPV22_004779 [Ensete ventricosum]